MEAAALVHDLGHPPFGHIAEKELDRCVRAKGEPEGYEGNAQSFRIVARLAPHGEGYEGLDLTRATLNAVLKYPWTRDIGNEGSRRHGKFGVYSSEFADFEFARAELGAGDGEGRCLEAQVMDYADEVAYSVHDFEDFYRAGLIPVDALRQGGEAYERFLRRWDDELARRGREDLRPGVDGRRDDFLDVLDLFPEDFRGGFEDLVQLRGATSAKIATFVTDPQVEGARLVPGGDTPYVLGFLQQLIWQYVIRNPRLATQQAGQRRVIATLFETYRGAIEGKGLDLIPTAFHRAVEGTREIKDEGEKSRAFARLAADVVASFNDQQAVAIYRRLIGVTPGAITDILE